MSFSASIDIGYQEDRADILNPQAAVWQMGEQNHPRERDHMSQLVNP